MRDAARTVMWVEVYEYVAHNAKLPIGPLNDDHEARCDIAVSLLRRLVQDDFRHVRQWRDRQRVRTEQASWWGWIQLMAWSLGIDFARGSRQNLAKRGQPFRWARIVPVDPHVLADAFGESFRKPLEFLIRGTTGELAGYFTELQDAASADADPGDDPPQGGRVADRPRPTNGKGP